MKVFGGWTPFFLERGPYKESLSEYGSGWGWENDYSTYAHVLDQTNKAQFVSENKINIDDTPIRYLMNGTKLGYCDNDWEITDGKILFSGTQTMKQKSCKPNNGNGGNLYSWPATTSGGASTTYNYSELNSICPIGWQLTIYSETDSKSYYALIRTAYGISGNKEEEIRLLPLSFVRSGWYYYQGSIGARASEGHYYTATVASGSSIRAEVLAFWTNVLKLKEEDWNRHAGFSVRCVSR